MAELQPVGRWMPYCDGAVSSGDSPEWEEYRSAAGYPRHPDYAAKSSKSTQLEARDRAVMFIQYVARLYIDRFQFFLLCGDGTYVLPVSCEQSAVGSEQYVVGRE